MNPTAVSLYIYMYVQFQLFFINIRNFSNTTVETFDFKKRVQNVDIRR
jgi:hypothetical protein